MNALRIRYGVDPWPRIDFYVRNGLLPQRPTFEQLRQASTLNVEGFGFAERTKYFLRHPAELLPTRRRQQTLLRMSMPSMEQTIAMVPGDVQHRDLPPVSPLDRILKSAYQFAPLRFVTACCFNPYFWPLSEIDGTGLTLPLKNLISHVMHTPHYTALWDVQIIHADDGGLDRLEAEIEMTATGRGPKARLYRAMTQSMQYYDHLRDLLPRVRRFEYPPPPPGYGSRSVNLVEFLNYATTL